MNDDDLCDLLMRFSVIVSLSVVVYVLYLLVTQ